MANPVGGTEQSLLVTVTVNNFSLGVFDTFTGGDASSKATMHRPGGMGNQKAYVSLPAYTDMTVSRVVEPARDWIDIAFLVPIAGRVIGSVSLTPLDGDGNAYGHTRTASGLFLGIKGIKGDSNSEAVQMFDLDFAIESWG